jgi:hypothetical protein
MGEEHNKACLLRLARLRWLRGLRWLTGLSGLRQLRGFIETGGLTGQRGRMSELRFQRGLERFRWLRALRGQSGPGRLRYHAEGKHHQGIVVFNE